MNLFKTYSYTWWQMGVFKLALLSIGVLIGVQWAEFWNNLTTILLLIAVVTTVYIMYVSLKQ